MFGNNPDDESYEETMKYLLEINAAYLDGVTDKGEAIYKFNVDILQEKMPDLYWAMMDEIDEVLVDLLEKDLIEVEYDEDLNASFRTSPQGVQELIDRGIDLPEYWDGV